MHDHQMPLLSRQTGGDEAVFLIRMQRVGDGERERVEENSRRLVERHGVLQQVGFRLVRVLLEL